MYSLRVCGITAGPKHPSLGSLTIPRPTGAGGDTAATGTPSSASASVSMPFPAEASTPTPLWRQVAVPGALVVGAVGALGTYYSNSRSGERERGGPNQNQNQRGGSSHAHSEGVGAAHHTHTSAAEGDSEGEGEGAGYGEQDGGGAYNEGTYSHSQGVPQPQLNSQERLASSQRHQPGGGTTYLPMPLPFQDGDNNNGGGRGGEASSLLAGEFRRLTETMEQQTGHLLEAVGAMKTLASRAEQDSSSLLAARVSSHTSELRAELGTIKQLLLLQAGVEGGAQSRSGAVAVAAAGAISANTADVGAGRNAAAAALGTTTAIGGAQEKDESKGGLKGSDSHSVKDAADQHVGGLTLGANTELPAKDLENDKSNEGECAISYRCLVLLEKGREGLVVLAFGGSGTCSGSGSSSGLALRCARPADERKIKINTTFLDYIAPVLGGGHH